MTSPAQIAVVAQAAERRHAADPEALLLGGDSVNTTVDPDVEMHSVNSKFNTVRQ